MMTSIRRAALAAFVLALAFSGALQAAGEGRIIATVLDETGAPVEGAKVILTRPGTGYKLEKVSDKKGQVMLLDPRRHPAIPAPASRRRATAPTTGRSSPSWRTRSA